jgi:mono/diheme cytochrome c family protein
MRTDPLRLVALLLLATVAAAPTGADADAIERGRALFARECATCHGSAGRGDGPMARTLPKRPADLRVHVPAHPDGELAKIIADGIPGTPMPGFAPRLSDEERQDLLRYLRRLAPAAGAPAGAGQSEGHAHP